MPDRVGSEGGGKNLQSDNAAKTRIPSPVHFAHPSGADGTDDLIASEAGTC